MLFVNGRSFPLQAGLTFAGPLLTDEKRLPAAKTLLRHLGKRDFLKLLAALATAGAFRLERCSFPMPPPKRRTNNRLAYAAPSGIHGQGLFARTAIPAETDIVPYDGPRIWAEEGKRMAEEGNIYVFQANRREFIDGSVAWNLAGRAEPFLARPMP